MAGAGYQVHGDVAVVTLDHPPVNALAHVLRAGVMEALNRAAADPAIRAVVLAGAGRCFSSGADITEFGKPPQAPILPDLNARIEGFPKPIVAAIHGFAFGGGLEVTLCCHARVASPEAQLGLPEVKLGLIPGAGGTQRLPRLVGPERALDIIVSGKPISGTEAATIGLADRVADDPVAAAIELARELARSPLPAPVRDREERLTEDRQNPAAFDAHAAKLTAKSRGLDAPAAAVAAVRMALDTPFDEALKREREMFLGLMNGAQSRAQRHLFFAEREALKVPGIGPEVQPRPVARVAVIGAGTMGGGIAMAFLNGGFSVTLLEASQEALDRGLATIRRNYDTSVQRGSMTAADRDKRLERLSPTTDYSDLAQADLIVEAVFEDMSVKHEVFGKIDAVARVGAVLATNTSYLDVDAIAAGTSRPADVVGLHFFSPANVMKLLEIVRAKETAPDVLATALRVARQIGKVPVVAGVCHGFIGNRMLSARGAEIEALLLEGATPQTIDAAFTGFGFPMGPLAMGDLAGLDISWRNRKALGKTAPIADALVEAGRLGQKTGKGWYDYSAGPREAKIDPEVTALIEEKSRAANVTRREIGAQEIIERTLYPMINEGAKIVAEGIAARASDIDVVWVNGYGFPVAKGGPMHWAETEGLSSIAERLDHWHRQSGRDLFAPAPLLRDASKAGHWPKG